MAKDNTKETEQSGNDDVLLERENALLEREKKLDEKEAQLSERENALLEREQNLLGKEAELTQKEAVLKEKEVTLDTFEKALEVQKALKAEETTLLSHAQKAPTKEKGLSFTFRGEKYQFADDAPSHILFDGRSFSQEDIIKEEDALVILIGGNSSLIEKV